MNFIADWARREASLNTQTPRHSERGDVVDLDGAIVAAGSQARAVVVVSDAPHLIVVGGEAVRAVLRREVPDSNLAEREKRANVRAAALT